MDPDIIALIAEWDIENGLLKVGAIHGKTTIPILKVFDEVRTTEQAQKIASRLFGGDFSIFNGGKDGNKTE